MKQWYNSNVQINQKPVFYKSWYDKGIIYIKDIVDENYNFLTYNQLCNKFNINVPFTKYWGILDAISMTMKTALRQRINPGKKQESNYKEMLEKQQGSRFYYIELIEWHEPTSELAGKWGDILNIAIERGEICKIFENIKFITLNTKLRSFQLRLLHYAIVTNDKLSRWKVIDSDRCTFCNEAVETILHLIWDCQAAKHIWNQIQWYVKSCSNRTINLTLKNIIFCKFSSKPMDWLNTLCLITTQYLYSSRCLKIIPNFACLKQKILDMHNLEKYIAIKNNRLKKHEIKWKFFKS